MSLVRRAQAQDRPIWVTSLRCCKSHSPLGLTLSVIDRNTLLGTSTVPCPQTVPSRAEVRCTLMHEVLPQGAPRRSATVPWCNLGCLAS